MASLNSLLNPESVQERESRVVAPRPDLLPPQPRPPSPRHALQDPNALRLPHVPNPPPAPSPSSASPPAFDMAYERAMAQTSYYAQSDIVIRPHEPHPDCPDTLACLPDTNGRPQHTLPVILRCAILGSPKRRLTIREIYAAMEKKYPYYKTAGPAWKQSVRHHLSLNRLFERQPRPATDPGFGSYWTVNLEAPPGTKRPRKRGRAKDAPPPPSSTHALVPHDAAYRAPPPDPRAPPPHAHHHPAHAHAHHPAHAHAPHKPVPHIGALRPVDAHSFASARPVAPAAYEDEDDEDDEMAWETGAPIVMSDDEYDSEERSPYNYHPPPSASSAGTAASYTAHGHNHAPMRQAGRPLANGAAFPPPPYAHAHAHTHSPTNHAAPPPLPLPPPPPSAHAPSDSPLVDRLRQEIDSLKRAASDHEHLTLRLSNQLTRAETESLRVKQALKMAESRLEDEARRRVEAERAADEEARMRRQVEDSYRALQVQAARGMMASPM
ncbi:hypothetical protein EIP86_002234 [Pleurotus ostreatoroseus]|nr:hypothetical protein EIP86_002234 [Pleurotus ostreatoroseus]